MNLSLPGRLRVIIPASPASVSIASRMKLAKCTIDHDIRGWQQKFPLLKQDERIHPVPDAAGKRAGHGRRMLRASYVAKSQLSVVASLGQQSRVAATIRLASIPESGCGRSRRDCA